MSILRAHIDQPASRHRLTLLDEHRLRCLDCQRTLLLPSGVASTSTSQSAIPGPADPRCPRHEHEHHDGCRWCAAERKADPDADAQHGHREIPRPITADVAARVAEARAQLPTARPAPINNRTIFDRDRLAAAKAELDAHHARQHEADPT